MKNKRSLEDCSTSNIFFIKLEDGSKIVAGGVAVLSDALLVGDTRGNCTANRNTLLIPFQSIIKKTTYVLDQHLYKKWSLYTFQDHAFHLVSKLL